MSNSFEFIQQRPTIQNALDQAHGLGLDNIAFDTFVDVGDRATIWRTLFSDGILTFESDYKCPFKHIAVTIEPVQSGSGDPSPENVRPISGWTVADVQRTGKNLLPIYSMRTSDKGINYTVTDDGIWVHGTATASSYSWEGGVNYDSSWLKIPAGTYTFSVNDMFGSNQQEGYVVFMGWDSSGNEISNWTLHNSRRSQVMTFATDVGLYYGIFVKSGLTVDTVVKIQAELGSTATAYEPYSGSSLSINWQDEAGTVYGGTLAIDEDGGCVLTVGIVSETLNGTRVSSVPLANQCLIYLNNSVIRTLENISDRYTSFVGGWGTLPNNSFQIISDTLRFKDERFSAKSDFVDYLNANPLQVVYKLATPITYTLPDVTMLSSLLGTNNIWANTGGIAVTYKDFNPLLLTDPLNVGVMTLK